MIPLALEPNEPQPTVTPKDAEQALTLANSPRERALVLLLWTTGMRRSEIANLLVGDVDLAGGYLIVRNTKNRRPRVVPLQAQLRRILRSLLSRPDSDNLLNMSSNAIRLFLAHRGLPSAHAWRRGWAVASLKNGVSEASVRAVAGWSSGTMVAKYTKALSGELAIAEFLATWSHGSSRGVRSRGMRSPSIPQRGSE